MGPKNVMDRGQGYFRPRRYSTGSGGVTNTAGTTVAESNNGMVKQRQNRAQLGSAPGGPMRRRRVRPQVQRPQRDIGRVSPVEGRVPPVPRRGISRGQVDTVQPVSPERVRFMDTMEEHRRRIEEEVAAREMEAAAQANMMYRNPEEQYGQVPLYGVSPVETGRYGGVFNPRLSLRDLSRWF